MIAEAWVEYPYLQDVWALAINYLWVVYRHYPWIETASEQLQKRTEEQIEQGRYNTRAETLTILQKVFKLSDEYCTYYADFLDLMASALCGPRSRISLDDFLTRFESLKRIPFQ